MSDPVDAKEFAIFTDAVDILDTEVHALKDEIKRMERAIKRLEGLLAAMTVLQ